MRKVFPSVSVVVRSHNDGALIGRTLGMLRIQSVSPTEIICVEDHSTDNTAEVLRRFPEVKVAEPPSPYRPGKVLNFAISQTSGEIVVFNNSDAIPQDEFYLEQLIAPLLDDPRVGAVFANQLPRPDAEILVRKDSERAFGSGETAATWKYFFSLAAAAARRETLETCRFDETLSYSEDIDWSRRLKRQGKTVIYVPDAKVEHSHNYTPAQLKKRFFGEGYADYFIFGRAPSLWRTLRSFGMETLRDFVYLFRRRAFGAMCSAPYRRFLQKFSFYAGARRAERQRKS